MFECAIEGASHLACRTCRQEGRRSFQFHWSLWIAHRRQWVEGLRGVHVLEKSSIVSRIYLKNQISTFRDEPM
jgi:hypothetical protein